MTTQLGIAVTKSDTLQSQVGMARPALLVLLLAILVHKIEFFRIDSKVEFSVSNGSAKVAGELE